MNPISLLTRTIFTVDSSDAGGSVCAAPPEIEESYYLNEKNTPTKSSDMYGPALPPVFIVSHSAFGPLGKITNRNSVHTALATNSDKCKTDESSINYYSGTMMYDKKLVLIKNRLWDDLAHSTLTIPVPTPPGMTDCDFIKAIEKAAKANDDDVDYSFPTVIPWPGVPDGHMDKDECNSNTVPPSLIRQAGGTAPEINNYDKDIQAPGWDSDLLLCR